MDFQGSSRSSQWWERVWRRGLKNYLQTPVCYWSSNQTFSSPFHVSVRPTSTERFGDKEREFFSEALIFLLPGQELFGGYDGVKLLTGYLRSADRSQLASGLGHHRLLLSATDCVWCTVVGNPVVEDIFLELGGIFCLLDLLQVNSLLEMPSKCSIYFVLLCIVPTKL